MSLERQTGRVQPQQAAMLNEIHKAQQWHVYLGVDVLVKGLPLLVTFKRGHRAV